MGKKIIELLLTFLAGIGLANVVALFIGNAPLTLWLMMVIAGMVMIGFVEVTKRVFGIES